MNEYDVAVIGGGAAGLSAALVLARARRRVVVVDGGRPRNAPAARMHGFLSRDGCSPAELLALGRAEVASYGGELVRDTVADVDGDTGEAFRLRMAGAHALVARRLLLATGLVDKPVDIPGVTERWARDVLHCPYCHGHEVRDQPLGVLGGTPGAVQHALLVRQWSDDVVFLAHTTELTAGEREQLSARDVAIVEGPVAGLVVADDRVTGVELADGRVVRRTALFVRPAFVPTTDLVRRLGGAVDTDGWPVVDGVGRTTVPGVWAAGNASNARAQVITAAGEGSAAAIDINGDLTAADVDAAVRAARAGVPA